MHRKLPPTPGGQDCRCRVQAVQAALTNCHAAALWIQNGRACGGAHAKQMDGTWGCRGCGPQLVVNALLFRTPEHARMGCHLHGLSKLARRQVTCKVYPQSIAVPNAALQTPKAREAMFPTAVENLSLIHI